MFDGLKTWLPRYLMTYLVSSANPATPAKTHQSSKFHGWSGGVTTEQLRAPHGAWLVGWRGDEAVACGGVRLLSPAVAEVKRMYVDPSARGVGLARRLVARLEAEAVALGATVARLDTGRDMAAAVALYRSSGYRDVADYNGNPDAGWWFEKDLRAAD